MATESEENLNTVFALFLTLLLGAATRQILNGTRVPYTVALLLMGLAVGIASSYWPEMKSFTQVAKFEPHLLLFVFLPLLLFESAFNLNAHVFFKEFNAINLLAAPGIVIFTALLGFAGKERMKVLLVHAAHSRNISILHFPSRLELVFSPAAGRCLIGH
jgi:NhaP-type Na+/H+ or K+/H+ antiporter